MKRTTLFQKFHLLVVFLDSGIASAFVLPSLFKFTTHNTLFLAKKKKKKKRAVVSSSGGGFAKAVAVAEKEDLKPPVSDDDYITFPKLESRVQETLLPTPPGMTEEIERTGSLPYEIYDRLEQIYGFPDFNHKFSRVEKVGEKETDDEGTFLDLLAAPPPTVSSSVGILASNTTDSKIELSELLATVTGGVETKAISILSNKDKSSGGKENATAESEMRNAISSLPPFENVQVLHLDPLILQVDDFFSEKECDRYVEMSLAPVNDHGNQKTVDSFQTRSKTVGTDSTAKSQRTSTTWFHYYKNVPELISKASRLVGLDSIDRWEEPQTVRYQRSEKFTWHLDALAPTDDLGGQRLATLLVYLKDLELGGATIFRDLGPLKVQPKKGSALIFFPAAGGIHETPFDIRTLHCGEIVPDITKNDKWISQLWLRSGHYSPTAPPGNLHEHALNNVKKYCNQLSYTKLD